MPDVKFRASCSLMEDYRFATEISVDTTVAQVTNAAGQSELFYSGSDGKGGAAVYGLQPDPASDTGWSAVTLPTDIMPEKITGGMTRNMLRVYVLRRSPRTGFGEIQYAQRNADGKWGWFLFSSPPLPGPREAAANVRNIKAEVVNGSLELAAVASDDKGKLSVWRSSERHGWQRLGSVDSTYVDFCTTKEWGTGIVGLRNAPSGDTLMVFFSLDGKTTTTLFGASSFRYAASALQAPDAQGNAYSGIFVYTYSNGPRTYFMDCGADNRVPVLIDNTVTCTQIAAIPAGTNPITFCALDNNGQLNVQPQTGTWMRPINLGESFSSIAPGLAADGAPQLFAVDTKSHRLCSMLQEPLSTADGRWVKQDIEVQSKRTEKVEVYGTTFTLMDANGNKLPNLTLALSSPDTTTLAWRSNTLVVGPGAPATLTTDANGQVTLYAQTATINSSKLVFSTPGTPAGDAIVVDADDHVRSRLQNITVPQTKSLLPPQFQNDAQSVQQAVQAAMQYKPAPPKGAAVTNARYVAAADVTERYERLIDPASVTIPHWHFSVADGRATFRELTDEEASRLRQELRADVGGGFWSSFKSFLGNIATSAGKGVAKVVNYVVQKVGNAVEATIRCVINGVNYVFDGVIKTIERAMEVATTIFNSVLVFFKTLFNFLAWLFTSARQDIWNTKNFFERTLDRSVDFLQHSCSSANVPPPNFFKNLRASVSASFDTAIQNAGGKTFNYQPAATSVAGKVLEYFLEAQVKVNWLLDKVLSFFDLGLTLSVPQSLTDAIQKLTNAASSTLKAFTGQIDAVGTWLSSVAGDPANFMSTSLSAVLRAAQSAVLAILDVLDSLAQQFMAAAKEFFKQANGILGQRIGGFFLEAIYNLLNPGFPFSSERLTVRRLVAILCAFPATIIHVAITGSAPMFFAEEEMTADMMAAGAKTAKTLGGILMIVWSAVDVSVDVQGTPLSTFLGAFAPMLMHLLLAPGYPAPLLPSDNAVRKATNAFWIVGWLPIGWTSLFTMGTQGKYGPRKLAWSCGVLSATGFAVLAAGIAKSVEETKAKVDTFGTWFVNIAAPLVTMAKPMKFSQATLPPLLVIDVVGDCGVGVIACN